MQGQDKDHRYVIQASLNHILATCHPASLAEGVTWASAPVIEIVIELHDLPV